MGATYDPFYVPNHIDMPPEYTVVCKRVFSMGIKKKS